MACLACPAFQKPTAALLIGPVHARCVAVIPHQVFQSKASCPPVPLPPAPGMEARCPRRRSGQPSTCWTPTRTAASSLANSWTGGSRNPGWRPRLLPPEQGCNVFHETERDPFPRRNLFNPCVCIFHVIPRHEPIHASCMGGGCKNCSRCHALQVCLACRPRAG